MEMPETIAITIHDSILTGGMRDNADAVKRIMEEELTKFVGFAPNISIENTQKESKRRKQLSEEGVIKERDRGRITKQYDATAFVSDTYSVI